jgi:3-oxoacyl-[acyl-carrier protein] reductase
VVADITDAGGKAVAAQADVSREVDVQRLFAETMRAFGRVDVLVNNAGVYEFAPLDAISEAHVRRLIDVNVLGPLLTSREAAKHFGVQGGSIVNISSVVSTATPPNASVYSATKAALDAMTKSLAKELGPRRIRVNALNPGMVETEGWRAAGLESSDLRKQVEAQTPLGRIGQPRDIAPAAVFLASDDAAWITGETILVSGGLR